MRRWGPLFLVLIVVAWGVWQASRVARADFASMQARYRVDAWLAGKEKWTLPQWVVARSDLLEAARIAPDSPITFDYLAALYIIRGQRAWSLDDLRQAYFTDAETYQRQSLLLRPHNGAAWANLALSQHALGESEGMIESMRKALTYGPNELRVRQVLGELVLANWKVAPDDLRDWLKERHETGPIYEKRNIERLAQRYGVSFGPEALSANG